MYNVLHFACFTTDYYVLLLVYNGVLHRTTCLLRFTTCLLVVTTCLILFTTCLRKLDNVREGSTSFEKVRGSMLKYWKVGESNEKY